MSCGELGLSQRAKVRLGWLQFRDTPGVSDRGVEIADLCCQECSSALDLRISLIGRDPVQRGESFLETSSLLLDDTQPFQRLIPVPPVARIS